MKTISFIRHLMILLLCFVGTTILTFCLLFAGSVQAQRTYKVNYEQDGFKGYVELKVDLFTNGDFSCVTFNIKSTSKLVVSSYQDGKYNQQLAKKGITFPYTIQAKSFSDRLVDVSAQAYFYSTPQMRSIAAYGSTRRNLSVDNSKGCAAYDAEFSEKDVNYLKDYYKNHNSNLWSLTGNLGELSVQQVYFGDFDDQVEKIVYEYEKEEQAKKQAEQKKETEEKGQQAQTAQQEDSKKSADGQLSEQDAQAVKAELDKMQASGQITEEQARMAKAEIDKRVGRKVRTEQNTANSDNNDTEAKREKTSSEIYEEYMEKWAKKDAEIQRKAAGVGSAVEATGNAILASQGIDGAKSLVWKCIIPEDMVITANNFMYEIQPGTSGKFFYGTFGFGVGTASYEAKNPSPYAESDDLDDVETSGLGATAECSLGLRFPFYKEGVDITEGAFFCGLSGDYSLYFDDQDVNPMVHTLGAFAGVNLMHLTIQFGGGTVYNSSGDLVNYKADSGYAGKSGMLYIKAGFVW